MPIVYKHRRPPQSWREFRPRPPHPWLVPFSYLNWAGDWLAYALGQWTLFEVLDYAGSFSILIAVIFYFAGAGDRLKTKHYQAWQVINTAQGKGGSGGRIDALQELNADGVSLTGVDLTDAYLQGADLSDANLHRAIFIRADLRNAVLRRAHLASATFDDANLRGAHCPDADLSDASLNGADLYGCDLSGASVTGATFDDADLSNVDFANVNDWHGIRSMKFANVHGVQHADDFVVWAKSRGAVDIADDAQWIKQSSATSAPATGP